MTIVEKILSAHSGGAPVRPGHIVVVNVDVVVPIDLNFYDGFWHEPVSVFDPEKVAIIFDHVVPPPDDRAVLALDRARQWAARVGVTKIHDVGPEQGICHELIADVPYARPGELLVCTDSHTCSGGALNCAARGIGPAELIYALAKGYTWFQVAPTVRYELHGRLQPGVSAKDVFMHLADVYGHHVMQNVEFGGPGVSSLTIDQRRQLTTMCAEISAEFAVFEPDGVLEAHLTERGLAMTGAVWPDSNADYAAVRQVDLSTVGVMVGLPDSLVHNTVPVERVAGTPVNRAFIGSCANGTLDDLRDAAKVLEGRQVAPGVTLLVTPASQKIYRRALKEGLIEVLIEAGSVVTTSSCGACVGFIGRLGADDVCISSSTRNFKGRMGHPDARIYLSSSATVAASAVAGEIISAGALPTVQLAGVEP